jgi:AbrB family looped-hinge helix DNA binding protein
MKSTLVVSHRGQITLPAFLRNKMGIGGGGVVTVEEQGGKLVLSPAAVMEVEMYSDEQIRQWVREDTLAPGEKERLDRKLSRRVKK